MNFFQEWRISEFFDVSIVMSWYKKLRDFERVFPRNLPYFQRNGIEVIIVMDDDGEEKELLSFIESYPLVNWKIVVNRKKHQWRNHCKVLNVGIRHASHKYILILDPEVELITDLVYQLRYMLQHHTVSFAIGNVIFVDHSDVVDNYLLAEYSALPYGSIMAERSAFEEIGGYDESYTYWGGEDDNIRSRFQRGGWKKVYVPQAVALHREYNADSHTKRFLKSANLPLDVHRASFYASAVFVNGNDWGREFSEVIFNWEFNKLASLNTHVLKQFRNCHFPDAAVFERKYRIIALLQVRNEIHNIEKVVAHLSQHCDGIIVLDDESVDGTYEACDGEKLLLKAQIGHTGVFNDLRNRNLLLQLGNLFECEWFVFVDADERFDPRYGNLYDLADLPGIDSVIFRLIHLWDVEGCYRADLPEGENGLLERYRMFRNKGFTQIVSSREIHFPATPFRRNSYLSNILIHHWGLFDLSTRRRKFITYGTQDADVRKQGYKYDYLLSTETIVLKVSDIEL